MADIGSTPPPPPSWKVPQQAPPLPGGPSGWNAGTRYMCAGTHLDERFARTVVAELRDEKFRACAPSYGADLRHVARHAERALRAVRTRDKGIAVLFVLAFLLTPAVAVLYAVVQKIVGARRTVLPSLPGVRRLRLRRDGDVELDRANPTRRLLSALGGQALVLGACSLYGAGLPLWGVPNPFVAFVFGLVLLVCGPWFFAWQQQTEVWETLSRELGPESGGPTTQTSAEEHRWAAEAGSELPASATGGDGNLVIHSGYLPFVGAGTRVDSWSFGMRLQPEGHEPGSGFPTGPLPVDTDTLITALRDDLGALRTDDAAADSIRGLRVTEKVFVEGSVLQTDRVLGSGVYWPGHGGDGPPPRRRPTDSLPAVLVERVRGLLDGPVRHSLCAEVRGWDADVVLSLFLQAAVSRETLYLQCDTYVLAPVSDYYRQADTLTRRQAEGNGARLAADALTVAGRAMGSPVVRGANAFLEPWQRARREKRAAEVIAHNRCHDFGARQSLRQVASPDEYTNFFQRVDVSRNTKQLQLTVFASLTELLARNGLDTGELLERRNTILNNGIMMTGGSVTGSLAAGTGATANFEAARSPRPADGATSGGGKR